MFRLDFDNYKKELIKSGELSISEIKVIELISKLESLRKEANLTQRELAEKTGMSQPQLARFENFDSTPNLTTLIKIADGLGYTIVLEEQ